MVCTFLLSSTLYYMIGRNLLLPLLTCSAWPCLGPAYLCPAKIFTCRVIFWALYIIWNGVFIQNGDKFRSNLVPDAVSESRTRVREPDSETFLFRPPDTDSPHSASLSLSLPLPSLACPWTKKERALWHRARVVLLPLPMSCIWSVASLHNLATKFMHVGFQISRCLLLLTGTVLRHSIQDNMNEL